MKQLRVAAPPTEATEYDERLLSPRRLVYAALLWGWFTCVTEVRLPFWQLLRYYRRPYASRESYR